MTLGDDRNNLESMNRELDVLLLLCIDHTQNGAQYIYIIHMEYEHVHKNKYIQIHMNPSVAINLMKVSIFDLVKPSMLYISHYANKSILIKF